jgi:VanZ family protein
MRRKIFFGLAILTAIFIFYISTLSSPPNPQPGSDWVSIAYHFGIFFLLALFLILSTNFSKKQLWFVYIFSTLYGISDEFHQYFVPYRACTLPDMMIDGSGVVCAFIFIWIVYKLYKKFMFRVSQEANRGF